ncbi:hypothetical protein JCM1840_004970 [Sporobolomyces johnsonii]
MAPSLLQTLLREPSRSYQNIYQEEQAASRPGSPLHSYSSSRRASSTLSVRSSSSNGSYSRTREGTGGRPGPAWSDGPWEWSKFGGRRGLTGGSASLHTPSVVGKSLGLSSSSVSLRSERLRVDDGGSVRSGRSARAESLRMSLPSAPAERRKHSVKGQSRAPDQDGQAALPRRSRTKSAPSLASRRHSHHDDLPPVPSSGFGGTSRRYSSASPAASPSPAPLPDNSDAGHSTPLRQTSDDATPSLTSSASSVPSSPPATPVQAVANALLPLAPDSSHPKKASITISSDVAEPAKQLSSKTQQPTDVVQDLVGPARNAETERPSPPSSAAAHPEPVPGRFYSVDEFFAIATAPTTASADVTASPISSNEDAPTAPVDSSAPAVVVSSEDTPCPPPVRSESDNASFTTAGTASADVPDWLKRIRVLGEPIQPLVVVTQPPPKKPLASVPHWTVQQLHTKQNSGGLAPPPGITRPKSLSSLRSRTRVLEGLPEEEEEEEPPVPAMPTWLPKKAQTSASQMASRTTRAAGGAKAVETVHRRAKSADDPGSDKLRLSPLSRTSSLASSITSSTPSASLSLSRTSSSSGMRDVNIDLAELGTPRPKRMSKFFQPPLTSTKAVKPPPVVPVVNPPRVPLHSRPASLRQALAIRDGEEDQHDADSNCGGSQLSIMSAPQLTPPRPPRNPARSTSLAVSTETDRPSSRPISRSFSAADRPSPRPPSISFTAAERPSSPPSIATSATERSLPPPPLPVLSATAPPSRTASTLRSNARPLSSYLPPTIDFDMSALAISPRLDTGKTTSKRFSIFRSSSSTSSSSRPFEPSIDLLYERIDAASFQKRLKSDEVLVEAIAVGLDRWDVEKAWAIAKTSGGAGWVPGRAVYGKVMACGDSITRVKKGDLVWGLNPLKKSFGLASMVVLHRDNVAVAPIQEGLEAEQLAVLPAVAIAAMQIMESLCSELPKGSKVLVLNAHQGIGYLCLQLARYLRPGAAGTRDLWMAAQCPNSLQNGEVICKEAGASEVLRDEPLAALNGIHEGSFDVVIDTIGGRRLYDASRRILHNSGSFISTVGDSLTSPNSASANYHTSIRSLRRTFFKKDKKAISYWLAHHEVDERECVRDVLDKVKEAVQAGALSAKVGRIWSFSDARRAFEEREADSEGVVVKVKQL